MVMSHGQHVRQQRRHAGRVELVGLIHQLAPKRLAVAEVPVHGLFEGVHIDRRVEGILPDHHGAGVHLFVVLAIVGLRGRAEVRAKPWSFLRFAESLPRHPKSNAKIHLGSRLKRRLVWGRLQ